MATSEQRKTFDQTRRIATLSLTASGLDLAE